MLEACTEPLQRPTCPSASVAAVTTSRSFRPVVTASQRSHEVIVSRFPQETSKAWGAYDTCFTQTVKSGKAVGPETPFERQVHAPSTTGNIDPEQTRGLSQQR